MKETLYRRSITLMLTQHETEMLDKFQQDNEYISLPKYTKSLLFKTFLPEYQKNDQEKAENITL